MSVPAQPPRVAIVGGGLAGLAAAVALAGASCRVELFEARRQLGGRASSFRDSATDQWIDNCQHVSMGCCTNLADFSRRTGMGDCFRADDVLNFVAPDGRIFTLQASPWLPAPLHLAPALFGLKYLSLHERLGIASAMWRLMRRPCPDAADGPTIAAWLQENGQSTRAIEQFWAVVLVSALGETLDRASLSAAQKVFVDGFMMSPRAYRIEVPRRPLGEIYGERLEAWLAEHGVQLHLGTGVKLVTGSAAGVRGVTLADGSAREFDFVIAAAPWRRLPRLLAPELQAALPWLADVEGIQSAPITGIHLWFDRPITNLPHAVLVGRMGQWLFNRSGDHVASDNAAAHAKATKEFYYQVVISGSRELAETAREAVIEKVRSELADIWPAAREAELLRARVVTDPLAVFSVQPGFESLRPPQRTAVPGLMIAGDWTRTGWPATMESAVRSGYLAAEGVLQAIGSPKQLLVADLSPGWLARLLVKRG